MGISKKIVEGSKVSVKNQEEILNYLEREGFNECVNGNWRRSGKCTFYTWMFESCNKEFVVEKIDNSDKIKVDGYWFEIDWLELIE